MNKLHTYLTITISFVWIINGAFCKLGGLTSRHQEIASRIIGPVYSELLTQLIGIGEIAIGVWVLSCLSDRCTLLQ